MIFLIILLIYISGQFLIGTYHPDNRTFVYDAPADIDFLYYGAIVNQLLNDFPPENPSFAGEKLTQPFIQYYPAAILSKIFGPFNGIRILNVLYLVFWGLIFRRFFRGNYGAPLVIILAASIPATDLNSLGVDLIARGFTHTPFFLLLTIVIFGKNLSYRLLSIFTASFINGYLMLMVIPYLLIIAVLGKNRHDLYVLFVSAIGLALASIFISSSASEKPLYFIFEESFYFAPLEILKHAAIFILFAFIFRNKKAAVLLAIAIVFGSFIHYNPFFPVFMVYFAGALMLTERNDFIFAGRIVNTAVALMFVAFLYSAYQKYDPDEGNYFPRYDTRLDLAMDWIKENTRKTDRFIALNSDGADMALIMLERPIHLGYIGHVAHLGLNWRPRYNDINQTYLAGRKIEGCDYIFYGPVEKKYFPKTNLAFEIAYRDNNVVIYKLN